MNEKTKSFIEVSGADNFKIAKDGTQIELFFKGVNKSPFAPNDNVGDVVIYMQNHWGKWEVVNGYMCFDLAFYEKWSSVQSVIEQEKERREKEWQEKYKAMVQAILVA